MDLNELRLLKERVSEYREENPKVHSAVIYCCCGVEISANLVELYIIRGKVLSEDEKKWFSGERIMQDVFQANEKWEDIFIGYMKLVTFVDDNNLL
jgi:hypothetical protein